MFSLIKELFALLTPRQRKRFYHLQFLVTLMALMELIGIASIGPFMALIGDSQLIKTNAILASLYQLSGLQSANHFLFMIGVGVLIALALASLISIITTWRLSLYAMQTGTELADRLYSHYLSQNWLFHANGSSAQFIKQIATETHRVTHNILQPFMQLNARLVLATLISISILAYSPLIAAGGLILFSSGYLIVYKLVKNRLINNGRRLSETNSLRYRLMHEGFGGIKDILLLDRGQDFIEQFNQSGRVQSRTQAVTSTLSTVPRYFMELIAFGAMIGLILVLIKLHNGVLSQVLPILAVYALAAFKLLPALQQIYASLTTIKGNAAAFEAIKPDLIANEAAIIKHLKSAWYFVAMRCTLVIYYYKARKKNIKFIGMKIEQISAGRTL